MPTIVLNAKEHNSLSRRLLGDRGLIQGVIPAIEGECKKYSDPKLIDREGEYLPEKVLMSLSPASSHASGQGNGKGADADTSLSTSLSTFTEYPGSQHFGGEQETETDSTETETDTETLQRQETQQELDWGKANVIRDEGWGSYALKEADYFDWKARNYFQGGQKWVEE